MRSAPSQYAHPVAFSRAAEYSAVTPVCAAHCVALNAKPVVKSHDSTCRCIRAEPPSESRRYTHVRSAELSDSAQLSALALVLTVYDGVIVGTPVGKSDGANVGQLVEETAGQYKVGGSVGVADGLALGTNVGGAVRVGT